MTKQHIGIIGLGDLGSQLAELIAAGGYDVWAYDTDPTKSSAHPNVHIADSMQDIFAECSLVHWAVPSRLLDILDVELTGAQVVLHDSVMHNSQVAIAERADASRFALAHYLVNDAKRVFVAEGYGASGDVFDHFQSVGLSPKLTSPDAHDSLMAHSQGILATLISLGVREELDEAAAGGDLTPSGAELHAVLMNRELRWTPNTLASILANPQLEDIVQGTLGSTDKDAT